MPEAPKIEQPVGRYPGDIMEREWGGVIASAFQLQELESALEATVEEWKYDEGEEAVELVRLTRELQAHVERLSLTADGHLTLWRECARCSGRGSYWDGKSFSEDAGGRLETTCEKCGGSGRVHADNDDD